MRRTSFNLLPTAIISDFNAQWPLKTSSRTPSRFSRSYNNFLRVYIGISTFSSPFYIFALKP